ncbi:unnamed protein product [Mucor hiemalis]
MGNTVCLCWKPLEEKETLASLPCGHIFHLRCLKAIHCSAFTCFHCEKVFLKDEITVLSPTTDEGPEQEKEDLHDQSALLKILNDVKLEKEVILTKYLNHLEELQKYQRSEIDSLRNQLNNIRIEKEELLINHQKRTQEYLEAKINRNTTEELYQHQETNEYEFDEATDSWGL